MSDKSEVDEVIIEPVVNGLETIRLLMNEKEMLEAAILRDIQERLNQFHERTGLHVSNISHEFYAVTKIGDTHGSVRLTGCTVDIHEIESALSKQ